ncbi:MAG: LptF/LptG family permease [Helicobacteraceae bacterium]|nr:LptF/LptG family permease [Helicobacteraceae bacterium]
MLVFRYIAFHYIRYFLIILAALSAFMVGFDFMENGANLPDSANLVMIYVVYKTFYAVDMLLPLALVFGMIATKVLLIRSNALVAFYSIGYSKNDVLKPFVLVSVMVISIYVALHATSAFARANEYATNIEKSSSYLRPTSNLFFTYENKFIFFGKLFPLQQRATDVRVFEIDESNLKSLVVAKSAYYKDDYWHVPKAHVMRKPDQISFDGQGIEIEERETLSILKGFKPKILDQVYEGKVNYTIMDAVDALFLLTDQNVNIDRIKSALYKTFLNPLFVPSLIIIIFFFVPISQRFLNITIFSFGAILATLMTWAVLFILSELSFNKAIPSELGIVLPVLLLFFVAVWQWARNSTPSKPKNHT